ncbi:YceI family protein [Aliamphritea hakodatensis]|uniref:YceI family protein n=1 Tax=Aliamphritea hakodatensis TaxID=2895352 RepID=UPI0022FD53AF|nr:YceI family protein [Aliamphritea hakodatensis]
MKLKTTLAGALLATSVLAAPSIQAADYTIDTKGAHASINFRVSHLGYSWLEGRFNEFSGQFSYDEANPNASAVEVEINTASVDSNHAERDKHLRSGDFLDVDTYPKASFKSTGFSADNGVLSGDLTLHGVTKPVEIQVTKIGQGDDPWGGYRAGFSGTTEFQMKDFGITKNLGPASETVYMELHVEGIRQ